VPAIAQQRYLAGKKLFDSADYAKALEEFTLVMQLVDELGARANDSTLSDLKVLAGGFSDLAQRSIAPPKPSPAPESAPPKATPASNATVAPTPPATSSEISPPIVIAQQVPEYPPRLTALAVSAQMDGVVEVTIGADGLVKSVTVVKGIHPLYDELLIAAAKQWRYLPAMQNGRPVEFVKRLTVLVKVRPGRPGAPPLEPS
jgi:TonB family protein